MFQRSIFTEYGNPSKVFMCLELGVIPVRFVVIEKILKFLKYILNETSIPFVPGGFTFDADYIVLTYSFTDGVDLDTRTKVTVPHIGQTTLADSIGWCCSEQWPADGTPILTWGGDNTGTGFESVLIDLIDDKLVITKKP